MSVVGPSAMSAFAPLSESQRTSTVSLNYLTTGSSARSKPPGINNLTKVCRVAQERSVVALLGEQ